MNKQATIKSAAAALIIAAKRREYPMGDPSALIAAKANLRAAVAHMEEVLAAHESTPETKGVE